jgi:hypothetical protein
MQIANRMDRLFESVTMAITTLSGTRETGLVSGHGRRRLSESGLFAEPRCRTCTHSFGRSHLQNGLSQDARFS